MEVGEEEALAVDVPNAWLAAFNSRRAAFAEAGPSVAALARERTRPVALADCLKVSARRWRYHFQPGRGAGGRQLYDKQQCLQQAPTNGTSTCFRAVRAFPPIHLRNHLQQAPTTSTTSTATTYTASSPTLKLCY